MAEASLSVAAVSGLVVGTLMGGGTWLVAAKVGLGAVGLVAMVGTVALVLVVAFVEALQLRRQLINSQSPHA